MCPYKGGVCLTENRRKWPKNAREQLLVTAIGFWLPCSKSKKMAEKLQGTTLGVRFREEWGMTAVSENLAPQTFPARVGPCLSPHLWILCVYTHCLIADQLQYSLDRFGWQLFSLTDLPILLKFSNAWALFYIILSFICPSYNTNMSSGKVKLECQTILHHTSL